jgi:site-specific DNA-methyltransferase (adenine-specific)
MQMMARYPDGYFDLCIIDPPYGTMHCAWDDAADLEKWIAEIYRVLKGDGTLICFGQQPMFSRVVGIMGDRFSHELIWEKTMKGGFLNANRMPLREHENIAVSKVKKAVYYKRIDVFDPNKKQRNRVRKNDKDVSAKQYGEQKNRPDYVDTGHLAPGSIVRVSNWNGAIFGDNSNASIHPTQKPVEIYRWLLAHYARLGAQVLDCFLGSASIAIACHDYGYDLTGCELDPEYFAAAMKRVEAHTAQQKLF